MAVCICVYEQRDTPAEASMSHAHSCVLNDVADKRVRREYQNEGAKEPAMGYIVGWLSADKNDGEWDVSTTRAALQVLIVKC